MSVKSLIGLKEVRDRLDSISPELNRPPSLRLLAEPLTKNYTVIGTAFDYALRFELQRRNPHAVSKSWVAENAIKRIPAAARRQKISKKEELRLTQFALTIVKDAKEFLGGYLEKAKSTKTDLRTLAKHAVGLAKLDPVYRALYINAVQDKVNAADIQDVANLLEIVPYEVLSHPKVMLLNPTFGTYSAAVGGADADLITGDLLVDVKIMQVSKLKRETVRQLIAYLILACKAREEDSSMPVIQRIGVYFSRQGYLWVTSAKDVTTHPRYADTEEWFIRYAAKSEMDPELRELWELVQEDKTPRRKRAASKRTKSKKKKG